MKMKWNEKISTRREEIHYTVADMMRILHVSEEKYTAWENGETLPNFEKQLHLADILGLPRAEMINSISYGQI